MKRLTMLAVALVALPLLAEEAAKKPVPAPAPAAQEESPLVAAARRSNRLGKKPGSKVITNATLAKANAGTARITTTENTGTLNLPAPLPPARPTPEMEAAAKAEYDRKAAAVAKQKRKDLELMRLKKLEAASVRAEDGMLEENDPDDGSGDRDVAAAQKPPQS